LNDLKAFAFEPKTQEATMNKKFLISAEGGKDYVFATERFHMVRLPSRIEEALLGASEM
jgi:hypothetical protein